MRSFLPLSSCDLGLRNGIVTVSLASTGVDAGRGGGADPGRRRKVGADGGSDSLVASSSLN